jgi:hypothetical protein
VHRVIPELFPTGNTVQLYHPYTVYTTPKIPFNNAEGTRLTAAEIYKGVVQDMYKFCFGNKLSQVWAYLWNPYSTAALGSVTNFAIPRIKTTMIVESLWKQIKHTVT